MWSEDNLKHLEDNRDRDRMVVGFTTASAINAYIHYNCEFEPRSWQGVLDTTLYDKVCQWLAAGQWFSPVTPVSSTNKTEPVTLELVIVLLFHIMHYKLAHFLDIGGIVDHHCSDLQHEYAF
jgi:hypothetical protein